MVSKFLPVSIIKHNLFKTNLEKEKKARKIVKLHDYLI